MADRHRLGALNVRVSGHEPGRVGGRPGSQHIDQLRETGDGLGRRVPAVQPEVERDLVVAGPARVQGRPRRSYLGEPALDGGVDVLVGRSELEIAGVELALDPSQAALDGGQLRRRQQPRGLEPTCMRDAPSDVVRIELVIGLERRCKALELRQEAALEAPAPQLSSLLCRAPCARPAVCRAPCARPAIRYLVSLFASPSSRPKSRAWSCPWTRADVRRPMPQSLMKPAAADWSNSSPLP